MLGPPPPPGPGLGTPPPRSAKPKPAARSQAPAAAVAKGTHTHDPPLAIFCCCLAYPAMLLAACSHLPSSAGAGVLAWLPCLSRSFAEGVRLAGFTGIAARKTRTHARTRIHTHTRLLPGQEITGCRRHASTCLILQTDAHVFAYGTAPTRRQWRRHKAPPSSNVSGRAKLSAGGTKRYGTSGGSGGVPAARASDRLAALPLLLPLLSPRSPIYL